MHSIQLFHIIPAVFAGSAEQTSDVWGKDVTFERGKKYLVEAASGTGKSTLCSYLTGQRHDFSGRLRFDNIDASTLDAEAWADLRRRSVSHLFQELRLFPELTALENVEIKNNLTHHKSLAEIKEWFKRLGIADKLDVKVGKMSFGQQQRVALVRALCQPFDFLLADEPTSHLDDENAAALAAILTEEAQRQGAGIIITSVGKHIELAYDQILRL